MFITLTNTKTKKRTTETRKSGNCDALQLEDRTTARQSFWEVLGQICTTCMS